MRVVLSTLAPTCSAVRRAGTVVQYAARPSMPLASPTLVPSMGLNSRQRHLAQGPWSALVLLAVCSGSGWWFPCELLRPRRPPRPPRPRPRPRARARPPPSRGGAHAGHSGRRPRKLDGNDVWHWTHARFGRGIAIYGSVRVTVTVSTRVAVLIAGWGGAFKRVVRCPPRQPTPRYQMLLLHTIVRALR